MSSLRNQAQQVRPRVLAQGRACAKHPSSKPYANATHSIARMAMASSICIRTISRAMCPMPQSKSSWTSCVLATPPALQTRRAPIQRPSERQWRAKFGIFLQWYSISIGSASCEGDFICTQGVFDMSRVPVSGSGVASGVRFK